MSRSAPTFTLGRRSTATTRTQPPPAVMARSLRPRGACPEVRIKSSIHVALHRADAPRFSHRGSNRGDTSWAYEAFLQHGLGEDVPAGSITEFTRCLGTYALHSGGYS